MAAHGRPPAGRLIIVTLLILLAAGGAVVVTTTENGPAPGRSAGTAALAAALGGGTQGLTGYARALQPRRFTFPADHGPHPRFKHEWWYFTGNLEAPDGRRFGYELTFFRIALSPAAVSRASRWGTNQLYMAHFAVTDAASRTFHAFERLGRGAMGLAGARAQPFRVWVGNWSAAGVAQNATFPLRLRAARGDLQLDLTLQRGKPIVLEGDAGLSRKSGVPGNASYYYSLTRMPTRGEIRIKDRIFRVGGLSWMDREWATSALAPDQAGWDWFALQLSDGRDIMFYRLRKKNGAVDPHSAGTLVRRDGTGRHLAAADVELTVLDHWTSTASGIRYPAGWRMRLLQQDLSLTITPLVADQELDVSVTYWEGAVRIKGTARGKPVAGYGYLEMTGYGG